MPTVCIRLITTAQLVSQLTFRSVGQWVTGSNADWKNWIDHVGQCRRTRGFVRVQLSILLTLSRTDSALVLHRKSGSLNPFPVTHLRPEVELMYILSCADNMVTKVAENGVARSK